MHVFYFQKKNKNKNNDANKDATHPSSKGKKMSY
jgi:hypothetical protein